MVRLADAMQRARYAVAAAWLVAALISIAAVSGAFGTKLNDLLSNRFDLPGTESEHALIKVACVVDGANRQHEMIDAGDHIWPLIRCFGCPA